MDCILSGIQYEITGSTMIDVVDLDSNVYRIQLICARNYIQTSLSFCMLFGPLDKGFSYAIWEGMRSESLRIIE